MKRLKIKKRVRGKVQGTSECPRLSVYRSNKQIYAQIIDDISGNTLAAASSIKIEDKLPKKEIAAKVFYKMREGASMNTTTELRQAVEEALVRVPKAQRDEAVKKSCARTFQALRIDVNSEFEVLETFLNKLPDVLAPGGRVAILTFHSGEDRLVKQAFKAYKKMGIYEEVAKDVIRPSAEECIRNPRAKSTKMRWAIKAKE